MLTLVLSGIGVHELNKLDRLKASIQFTLDIEK